MIVIFSQHAAEYTTNQVIDWLAYNGADYFRFNGIEGIQHTTYTLENDSGTKIDSVIALDDNKDLVVWYRRWLPQDFYHESSNLSKQVGLNRQLSDYLRDEARTIRNYLFKSLKPRYVLSDLFQQSVNKLEVLKLAMEAGLTIPSTIVTGEKTALQAFLEKHGQAIVKNITEVGMFTLRNKFFVTFTAPFSAADLEDIPARFFPTLFQESIAKKYEVRVFYLEGTCYSMAMFSQSNNRTASDFRNFDYTDPNRNVPYKLPASVEASVDRLMKRLRLNCGSIDFIMSTTGAYIFLEVNPVGQFGMVSEPCNYYLEKKVAALLTHKDKQNGKETNEA
jgi:ATP-GRASP peptide maturase of grasp-with-spasm system